jgi:hypothetical protein
MTNENNNDGICKKNKKEKKNRLGRSTRERKWRTPVQFPPLFFLSANAISKSVPLVHLTKGKKSVCLGTIGWALFHGKMCLCACCYCE